MADDIIRLEKIFYKGASAAQRAQQIWPILVGWIVFGGKYLQGNEFFKEQGFTNADTFSPGHMDHEHLKWPLITYGDLARIMGYEHEKIGLIASSLDHPLYCIDCLCKKNEKELPVLNAIVVNQETGMPGDGYPGWSGENRVEQWKEMCKKVRDYKYWTQLSVPTIEQFEEAIKEA